MNLERVKRSLIDDEGVRLKAYQDHLGVWTLGIGHNIQDKPISERAALVILEDDINDAVRDLDRMYPWWRKMSENRQDAMVNWCFQLGIVRLGSFRGALQAIQDEQWEEAYNAMMDSRWAVQTPKRAQRIASIMRSG